MKGVCVMAKISRKKNRSELRQRRREYREQQRQQLGLLPKKMSASQLAEYVEMLQPVFDDANDKLRQIYESGYQSLASNRVLEQTGREYFDLFDVKSRGDLIKRLTAVRVFLADKGSTVEGAKMETLQSAAEKYKGKFGNQYRRLTNNFKTFDTSVIDETIAKEAFRKYRMIEEIRASQIGRQDQIMEGAYGSENLIIAMYDAEVRGKDSFQIGMELLDAHMKEITQLWEPIELEADSTQSIAGLLYDNIKGGFNF